MERNIADEMYQAILYYQDSPEALERYREMLGKAFRKNPEIMNERAPSFDASPFCAAIVNGNIALFDLVQEIGGRVTSPDGSLHVPGEPQGISPYMLAVVYGNKELAAHISRQHIDADYRSAVKQTGIKSFNF